MNILSNKSTRSGSSKRKTIKWIDRVIRSIIKKYYKRFPISKSKIVFNSYAGKGYGCNPKYIAEEIHRRGYNWDLVWLVKDVNEPMPDWIRKVRYGSAASLYELTTSKIWISNLRNSHLIPKKSGQFYLQTWHGPLGVKKAEKAIENILSDTYLKEAKYDASITDVFLSGSRIQTNNIRNNYWYDGEILECGLPRDDIFFDVKKEEITNGIKKRLNVKSDSKIILYAPTFRDNGSMKPYDLDYERIISTLRTRTGGNWCLLIRMHPNIRSFKFDENNDCIIEATHYPDMQELLLISDALITDYSSSMFDYMLLNKPVFIYANDVDEVFASGRLRELFFELPFLKACSCDELIDNLMSYSSEEYDRKMTEFKKLYSPVGNGNASKTVVDRLYKEIGR